MEIAKATDFSTPASEPSVPKKAKRKRRRKRQRRPNQSAKLMATAASPKENKMPGVVETVTNQNLSPGTPPSTNSAPPPELAAVLAEIEAEAPALASTPVGTTDGAQPAAALAPPSEPAFTPENFKEMLLGAVSLFSMLQGIPDEVAARLLSERAAARLAVHGVPVLNKYEVQAADAFAIWKRWRDEALFGVDLLAAVREGFKEWKAWRIEELQKKANAEARRGPQPMPGAKGKAPLRPTFASGPLTGPNVPADITDPDDGTGELPVS